MTFRLRFPTLFSSMRAAAEVVAASYSGHCSHCDDTTPWTVSIVHGTCRCTACERCMLRA